MTIGQYMNTNILAVSGDTSIREADKLMRENNVSTLPVVNDGRLVGTISEDKTREASRWPIPSLTIWNLRHLWGYMRVRHVMERDVTTAAPDTTIEDAVALAEKQHLVMLPVVVGDNDLVGTMRTEALYKLVGLAPRFGTEGSRIHIYEGPKSGGLAFGDILEDVYDITDKRGIKITSMSRLTPPDARRAAFIMDLDTDDASEILGELIVKGYDVEGSPAATPRHHQIVVRGE
jgi:CBS domain-containing protein/acetolactate synthase regulatory subunit